MKKLLLASVLAIASFPGYARPFDSRESTCEKDEECAAECLKNAETKQEIADCKAIVIESDNRSRTHVAVAPPYQGPPPIGWVYQPYTMCGDPPRCSMGMVNVPAAGLNVRTVPNGPPVMSL